MMCAMAADARFGTKIRRARERKRLTQQQLAEALAVSVRAIGDWENDRAVPRRSIGALEDILEISLGGGEPEIISPRLRKVIREELDPGRQAKVIGVLEGTLVTAPAGAGESSRRRA